jgi:hypothetical protein
VCGRAVLSVGRRNSRRSAWTGARLFGSQRERSAGTLISKMLPAIEIRWLGMAMGDYSAEKAALNTLRRHTRPSVVHGGPNSGALESFQVTLYRSRLLGGVKSLR